MPINELSERRRLPRLGKIHLGIKVKTDRPCKCKASSRDKRPLSTCRICEGTGFVFRPKETEYFVCPPEVQALYGEKPTELPIMFPVENEEVFFQQFYKRYGFGVLKCVGDGVNARTWDEEKGGFRTIPCPCEALEQRKCSILASLQFLLPDLPGAGVWQINTGSKNSVVDINSGIEYVRSMCGRIKMIPLILKREPRVIQRTENGKAKTGTHHTLQLGLANVSLRELQGYAAIPASRILLPPPDDSEDELFYPAGGWTDKNGKETEDETPEKEPVAASAGISDKEAERSKEEKQSIAREKEREMKRQETSLKTHKQELLFILKQYTGEGGTYSQKEEEELNALETLEDYKQAITKWRPRRDTLMKIDIGPKREIEEKPEKKKAETKQSKLNRAGPPNDLFAGEKGEK